MKLNQKTKMILGGVLIVLFILFGYWIFFGRKTTTKTNEQVAPLDGAVPTIDSSVQISLTAKSGRKEVMLSIKNMPLNTNGLEYILSYETAEGGLQGVNSTAEITGRDFEKTITLGTCSSGTCVYHNVKGKVKLELVFKGNNEDKYFSKEYDL